MKSLLVIIRPHVVPRLMEALQAHPSVEAGCIKEVKGYGRQKNYLNEYLGSEYSEAFLPKLLVEIRVEDDQLETVLALILEKAKTGRMGDGKIFILGGSVIAG